MKLTQTNTAIVTYDSRQTNLRRLSQEPTDKRIPRTITNASPYTNTFLSRLVLPFQRQRPRKLPPQHMWHSLTKLQVEPGVSKNQLYFKGSVHDLDQDSAHGRRREVARRDDGGAQTVSCRVCDACSHRGPGRRKLNRGLA